MTLPDSVFYDFDTALVWADTTDYSDTVSGLARTNQIDLTSLGAAAARQGTKRDMVESGVQIQRQFLVAVAFEFAVAPVSREMVEVWWAGSPSTTAGNANPGGTSGADAAYTGTAGDSIDDSIQQLQFIGSLIATADATAVVQYQTIGTLELIYRFGMPVVFNRTSQAFVADAVEMYVALIPLRDRIVN